ncbi:MAG: hypothetical protein NZL95_05305 [Chitinophagales bacterium]|nr:hypothetical protein [Chitinophagales bacterium]MDW8427951.1 hypothetical protein [Chitinophagales bacterium]
MSLTLTWPWWYVIVLAAAASVITVWLYYRDAHFAGLGKSFRPVWMLLAALRWCTIALILFLLSAPLLRTQTKQWQKPLLVFLQDESQSIAFAQGFDSSSYVQSVRRLQRSLQDKFTIRTFGFGGAVFEANSFAFRQPVTNISLALQQTADRFGGQHVGAIVLATDGIFNQGSNPLYTAKNLAMPVYTVALGDTAVRRDAAIHSVTVNRTVYLGDFFPVKTEIDAQACAGETSVLSLYEIKDQSQELIASQPVEFAANQFRITRQFIVKAQTSGIHHFRLVLQTVRGEISQVNNTRDFFVEVLEKKQRILLLAAAPHPDIGALRHALQRMRNYEVDVVLDPQQQQQWQQYVLVILYQLPAAGEPVNEVIQTLRRLRKPVWFILGAQTSVSLFNQVQSLLTIAGHNQTITDALPVLNPSFTLFSLSDALREQINSYPPLITPFGDYRPAAGTTILFKQKIGTVTTAYPLMLFREDLHGRTAVLCGEGLWRWRLWEYRQRHQHDVFDGWLSSVIQYLAAQSEEEPFRVWIQQAGGLQRTTVVSENEPVHFVAELVNDAGEYVNDPDVFLTLINEQGQEYPMTFNREGTAYSLNAGFFPVGTYTWKARTQWNNRTFHAAGRLIIAAVQQEYTNLKADHRLLYQISELTGGRMATPTHLDSLATWLLNAPFAKPVVYTTSRTQALINLHWLLAVLLFLLAAEWVLRKYYGTY